MLLRIVGSSIRKLAQFVFLKLAWSKPLSHIKHSVVLTSATYSPWLSDNDFQAIYEKIKKYTLVDIYRCYELWALAKQTANIDGDILEVGVWRGGTGAILAEAVKGTCKNVFLADTFCGVVKAGSNDPNYKGGEHDNTSIEIVNKLINKCDLNNTFLLKGIFPEDTSSNVKGRISLLHIDVDVYQSSKDIVEWCLPRLAIGGFIVFDDYGFPSCEGVTTYCEELRKDSTFRFIHNINGHAIFIKMR